MSAIASFYLLDISKLDGLVQNAEIEIKKSFFSKKMIDNYWNYLADNASELPGLNGSGYIYGNLLTYLDEEKNIDLLTNEYDGLVKEIVEKRGNAHFLFTNTQKTEFLRRLNPEDYSIKEIQKFNQDFSEEGDEETARLSLSALGLLKSNLEKIQSDNEVLLLIVG